MQVCFKITCDGLAHHLIVVQILMLVVPKLLIIKASAAILPYHTAVVYVLVQVISINETKILQVIKIIHLIVIIKNIIREVT
jgi:hypothetical protein